MEPRYTTHVFAIYPGQRRKIYADYCDNCRGSSIRLYVCLHISYESKYRPGLLFSSGIEKLGSEKHAGAKASKILRNSGVLLDNMFRSVFRDKLAETSREYGHVCRESVV